MAEAQTFDLNSAMLELFKCPICFLYMTPPIHRCELGHNFCMTCNPHIDCCPLCKRSKAGAHVPTLDRMYYYVKFPCKYREDGCDFKDIGWRIRDHEVSCEFYEYKCPLLIRCEWEGKRWNILEHCKKEHADLVHQQEDVTIAYRDFSTTVGLISYGRNSITSEIMEAHGETFLIFIKFSGQKYLEICVFFLGERELVKNFECRMKIGRDINDRKYYTHTKTQCAPYIGDHRSNRRHQCFPCSFDRAKSFCELNGDLHCRVQILKIDKKKTLNSTLTESVYAEKPCLVKFDKFHSAPSKSIRNAYLNLNCNGLTKCSLRSIEEYVYGDSDKEEVLDRSGHETRERIRQYRELQYSERFSRFERNHQPKTAC